jgi:hypothetical protein
MRVRRGRLARSGHTRQKVGVGLPGRALSDRPVDVPIELGKLGLQEIDMPVDGLEHARLTGETTAVFLRHDHLDDLTPTRHQLSQRRRFGVSDGPGGRPYGFGEVGDRRGVETIGLGELAHRAGEVADLTRIDDRQRQMRSGKRARDHRLVSARRLGRDEDGMKSAQALEKTLVL